jgi:hypothetical protein
MNKKQYKQLLELVMEKNEVVEECIEELKMTIKQKDIKLKKAEENQKPVFTYAKNIIRSAYMVLGYLQVNGDDVPDVGFYSCFMTIGLDPKEADDLQKYIKKISVSYGSKALKQAMENVIEKAKREVMEGK